MTESLQARLETALATLTNSRTGQNLVAGSQVRDIATTLDGKVRLTLLLHATDDATLARETRRVLAGVDGVTDVRVDVKDAAEFDAQRGARSEAQPGAAPAAPKQRGALPVMDSAPAAARASAPTPVSYPNLGRIIAVSSGKGGVGKSTVTVNLAVALAKRGKKVGLMDADNYGPNIPRMMGVDETPQVDAE